MIKTSKLSIKNSLSLRQVLPGGVRTNPYAPTDRHTHYFLIVCHTHYFLINVYTGCSYTKRQVIPGAVRTNPWRAEDFAKSIVKTLRHAPHHPNPETTNPKPESLNPQP